MPRFDPERHARPLCIAGTLAVVAGLYSGHDAGWVVAVLGVALLLTACYSRQDGFLLFGPFARADAVRSARSRRTHLVRAGVALAAGAVFLGSELDPLAYYRGSINLNQSSRNASSEIVRTFAISIGVIVPFLSVLLVSGAIAEERAAKRWEVLLTTDLRGRELVFGKLLGKLWLVVEPVVVILPILAMLPLIVGVPVQLMLVFGGAVAVTALALAGVAAFASSRRGTRGGAVWATFGLVCAYLFLSFGACYVAVWQTMKFGSGLWSYPRSDGVASPFVVSDLIAFVNCANPITTYLFEAATIPPPFGSLTPSLAVALRQYSAGALGVFLVGTLLACRRVRSVRDPNPAKDLTSRPTRPFGSRKPRESLQEKRAKLRPPVSDEPLAWWANCRLSIYRTQPTPWRKVVRNWAITVAVLLSIYAIDIVGRKSVYPLLTHYWQVNDWPLTQLMSGVVGLVVVVLLVIFAAAIPVIAATESIARERATDTFDSLRLTPLSAREMLEQIRAGCLTTSRIGVAAWGMLTLAAVVTGFFPPHIAVALGLLALAVTPPLVDFALYCSAWASTPARAMRNLIFGGVAWHYFLLFLGMAVFLGIPNLLGFSHVTKLLHRNMLDPDELVQLRSRVLTGQWFPTPVRYALTLAVYTGGIALYWLVGRWVFRRAVGRFARSRDATA